MENENEKCVNLKYAGIKVKIIDMGLKDKIEILEFLVRAIKKDLEVTK